MFHDFWTLFVSVASTIAPTPFFRYPFVVTGKSFKWFTFTKYNSVLLSKLLLPKTVSFIIGTSDAVVIICSSDELHAILLVKGKSWLQ